MAWQERRMDQLKEIPDGILRVEEQNVLITDLANARDRLINRRKEICDVWFSDAQTLA